MKMDKIIYFLTKLPSFRCSSIIFFLKIPTSLLSQDKIVLLTQFRETHYNFFVAKPLVTQV